MKALERFNRDLRLVNSGIHHFLQESLQAIQFDTTELPPETISTPKKTKDFVSYTMCNGRRVDVPMNYLAGVRQRVVSSSN